MAEETPKIDIGGLDKLKDGLRTIGNTIEYASQLNYNVTNEIANLIKSGIKNASDIQSVQFNISRSLGQTRAMSENLITVAQNALTYSNKVALNYNFSTERLVTLQKNIQEVFGKQTSIETEHVENLAAISLLFNNDDKKTADLVGRYTKLGVSFQKISGQVSKMWNTAVKEGLSFEKISDKVKENISKVNQYGFRNGIDGLRQMASYSEKIGLSFESTLRASDKLDSLQSSIETSAQLSNLGFITNPLELLGNAVTDVESLQKQIGNMFQNLGRFNADTGQYEINAFNRQRAKQMANSIGISYEEIINSIETQGRRAEIERQSKGLNIEEDLKNYIANTGAFHNGEAGFIHKGEFYNLSEISKNESLQQEIKSLSQDRNSDVKDIAKGVRDINTIISGTMTETVVKSEIAQKDSLERKDEELTGGTNPLLFSEGYELLQNFLTNTSKLSLDVSDSVQKIVASVKNFDGSINSLINVITAVSSEVVDRTVNVGGYILSQAFTPKTAQQGGEILGRSHNEGGTIIEAEKGEYIVNRNATKEFYPLLEKINSYQNPGPLDGGSVQKFRGGGITSINSLNGGISPINNNFNVPISITTNFKTETNKNIKEVFNELQPMITDWLNRKFKEDASYGFF